MSFTVFWKDAKIYYNVRTYGSFVLSSSFTDEPIYALKKTNLARKIEMYFLGERVDFSDIKVKLLNLNEFTKRVLLSVRKIPYGKCITYKELAKSLSTSPRAVGKALSKNPIPLIIPCHRVVSKSDIGGYSAGVKIKEKLLNLEGIIR
ncbi:cysteine methyltransferase [Archaeoglobales archaeon]|nr:MAG: cysteine methyltransferase [Archaeoglobales archaeon]